MHAFNFIDVIEWAQSCRYKKCCTINVKIGPDEAIVCTIPKGKTN